MNELVFNLHRLRDFNCNSPKENQVALFLQRMENKEAHVVNMGLSSHLTDISVIHHGEMTTID